MIILIKVLLIIVGIELILKDVIEDEFDGIFLGIILLMIGIGIGEI